MHRIVVASLALLALFGAYSMTIDAAGRVPGQLGGVLPGVEPSHAPAAVPGLVNYQGRLLDSNTGNPVNDGTYSVRFSVWNALGAGSEQWNETQAAVQTVDGVFSVLLGSVTPLTPTVFNGDPRYLEVKVGADAPMTPRQRFTTVAYAFFAGGAALANNAELVDNLDSSQFVRGDVAATKSGNLTLTNDLAVNGQTTLGDSTSDGTTVSGTLRVNENSFLGNSPTDVTNVEGDIILGWGSGTNDDTIFFDQNPGYEWFGWNDAQSRFDLSDDLNVTGDQLIGGSLSVTGGIQTNGNSAFFGSVHMDEGATVLGQLGVGPPPVGFADLTVESGNICITDLAAACAVWATRGNAHLDGDISVGGGDLSSGSATNLVLQPNTGGNGEVQIGTGAQADSLRVQNGFICAGVGFCNPINTPQPGDIVAEGRLEVGARTADADDFITFDSGRHLQWDDSDTRFGFSHSLDVGNQLFNQDAYLSFDQGVERVWWREGGDRFELTNDLAVGTDSGTTDDILYFDDGTKTFKWNEFGNIFEFNDDVTTTLGIYLGSGSPTDNDVLFFDTGALAGSSHQSLSWLDAADRFELSNDLTVLGVLDSTNVDLAERFYGDADLEAGELVMFDGDGANVARTDGTPYDARLAGIISTEPGFLLGSGKGDVAVALQGRVPLKVTDENGPIAPGDFLTSSSTPGFAMKATEPGPTVGIALDSFAGKAGEVLTFVSRGDGHTASGLRTLEDRVAAIESGSTSDGEQTAALASVVTASDESPAAWWVVAAVAAGLIAALAALPGGSRVIMNARRGRTA